MKRVAWVFNSFLWQVQICDGNSVGQLQVIRACGAVTGEKSAGAGNVFQIPAGAGWG